MTTSPEQTDEATDALVQAYIACKIAIDALSSLPTDVRDDAEPALREFCNAVEPALARRYPELMKKD
jgi:hypothetical protein